MNRTITSLLVGLLIVTGLALYYVWQGWQITDLSTRMTAMRWERDALVLQRDRLRVEISKIWSLEEIERRARERLGMKKIQPKRLVLFKHTPAP